MAASNKTQHAADALYDQVVGHVRTNGAVNSSELTAAERRAFAKIARDNGHTGDAVVDALTDAGINQSQARSFAAEMRKRENAGVTALALALPNPAGPNAVPPKMSEIRSRKNMARFTKIKHRDNLSRGQWDNRRKQVVQIDLPQLENEPALAEFLQNPENKPFGHALSLPKSQQVAISSRYLNTGKKKSVVVVNKKTGKTTKSVRNAAAIALANNQDTFENPRTGKVEKLHLALVPYVGPIKDRKGRAGRSSRVHVGPRTQQLLTAAIDDIKSSLGSEKSQSSTQLYQVLKAQADALKARNAPAAEVDAAIQALQLAEKTLTKTAQKAAARQAAGKKSSALRIISAKGAVKAALAGGEDAAAADIKRILKRVATIGRRSGATPEQVARGAEAQAILDAGETKMTVMRNVGGKLRKSRVTKPGEVVARLRENAAHHHHRDNGMIRRKRHNVGGMDAKTIGLGVVGFAGGTIVGTIATDAVKKLPMVGGYAPYLVAAGLAADAWYSHQNRGMIFKNIPNIGLRYGLAAGVIFPMIARGLASKLLNFARLGMVDNLLGGSKSGAAGFGAMDIYDTAFEDVSGTGEYLAENGFGEYLAENGFGEYSSNEYSSNEMEGMEGLGEYLAMNGLGATVTAAPAGFGATVTAAPAGFGEYLAESGLGATVTAAPAGFGEINPAMVREFAGVGSDDDAAGLLDASDLDGLGDDFSDDEEDLEGLGEDEGLSDEDLALEGLGAVAQARASGAVSSVQRVSAPMVQRLASSPSIRARLFDVRIVGRSQRVPGTFIVAVTRNLGKAKLPKPGSIEPRSGSVNISKAPSGQATFKPGGVFAETVFGGRGFRG